MRKRFAILIGAAALGAAVMAAAASADFRSAHDPRGDTTCHKGGPAPPRCLHSSRRNADIVRATAGHDGALLRHTVRVVGKFQSAQFYINTNSRPNPEWSLSAIRGAGRADIWETHEGSIGCGCITGHARMDVHRHWVEVFFSQTSIGDPQHYGWQVYTSSGQPETFAGDLVPSRCGRRTCGYIHHLLGGSGVAAAGVMALGVQTAAAAPEVVKYDTTLGITAKGACCLYLGGVKSDRDRDRAYHPANAVRQCMEGRRVILFELHPGADRRLGAARSHFKPRLGQGYWQHNLPRYHRAVYAEVTRKVGERFVCRADRSGIIRVHRCPPRCGSSALPKAPPVPAGLRE